MTVYSSDVEAQKLLNLDISWEKTRFITKKEVKIKHFKFKANDFPTLSFALIFEDLIEHCQGGQGS